MADLVHGTLSCADLSDVCVLPEHCRAQIWVPVLSTVCSQPLRSFNDVCCINRKCDFFYIWKRNQNCLESKRFRYSLISTGEVHWRWNTAKATSHSGSQVCSNHSIKLFLATGAKTRNRIDACSNVYLSSCKQCLQWTSLACLSFKNLKIDPILMSVQLLNQFSEI